MSDTGKEPMAERLKTISNDLKLYMEKRIELLLLSVGEQYSKWIAQSIQKATGLFLVFGAVVFLLVALAIYLGEVTGIASLGYVVVSLPLFIVGLLFFYLKPKSLVDNLQRHFEAELVEALTQNGESDKELLNLPESTEEKTP